MAALVGYVTPANASPGSMMRGTRQHQAQGALLRYPQAMIVRRAV